MSATVWQCECGAKYELREEFLGRLMRCRRCGVVKRVEKPTSIKDPPWIPEAASVRRREGNGKPLKKTEDDGDQHRVGNAALSEYMPNFDPDNWNEELVDVFRRIAVAVNELRERSASHYAGQFAPFSLDLDRDCWDSFDEGLVELLREIGRAIEQLRSAMENSSPLPSADFVFDIDESLYDDDLVLFVRRIEVALNGLRKGQSLRGYIFLKPSLLNPSEALSPSPQQRKDEPSWQRLVAAARDSGDHETAAKTAKEAVREYPRSAWLWRELGGELIEVDRLDEAEQALETALRLDPNAAWLWRRFAALHRKRKDLEQEIESLEKLYDLDVADSYDLNQLGIAYHNHRDLAKALKCYRLSAAAKNTSAPWFNLALVYSDPEISQDADAADACRCALSVAPDNAPAKELLERTKQKLAPLATQAIAGADGLVESNEFFDFYISPFEMLQIADVTAAEGLDAKATQQAKKRLLHELELNDGKVSWLGDYSLDKARAVTVVDELDDEAKRRYHLAVYRSDRLLNFLTRGDIQHFLCRDDYFPCDTEELLHREPGFRKFLSKPFAMQYSRVLTRAIEERRLTVVEVLFDGRRWVEPEDDDQCFAGAYKRFDAVVEEMRAIVVDSSSRKVSLSEMDDFFRKHSLPELFNLLPVHFASHQREIVAEIRSLAISCFNKHGDSILSRDVLSLCKRFTSRDVALNNQLQEDLKAIEAMILAERAEMVSRSIKPDASRSPAWHLGRMVGRYPAIAIFGSLVIFTIVIGLFNSTNTARSSRSNPSSFSRSVPKKEAEAPKWNLPPVALPANGTVRHYGYSEGIAPLTIATRTGGGHYFVKLRTVGTRELIAEVFVREGQQASIKVPLGTYELTYATGRTWYGRNGAFFGPETRYAKADDTLTFRIDGNQILGYTVELYLQAYGNLETEPMSAREF